MFPQGDDKETMRARMGLPAVAKNWPAIKDYSPDCNPSALPIFSEDDGDYVTYAIPVKELGAVVMRASCDKNGQWSFNGLSIFTIADIGYTELI